MKIKDLEIENKKVRPNGRENNKPTTNVNCKRKRNEQKSKYKKKWKIRAKLRQDQDSVVVKNERDKKEDKSESVRQQNVSKKVVILCYEVRVERNQITIENEPSC